MRNKGFIATASVMIITCGCIAALSATLMSALEYADSVERLEMRLFANIFASDCLDAAALMSVKDIFLAGDASIPDFNCTAHVTRIAPGLISISALACAVPCSSKGDVALPVTAQAQRTYNFREN